jgi:hypothetical protein
MKVTATIASKILIAAVAGWGFGVFVSQPFVGTKTKIERTNLTKANAYKVIQQNADWNKQNTVSGLDKIPNCTYVYEDVTNNPKVKCKLPCVSLYSGVHLIQRWEGNIMMKNDVTVAKVKKEMK